VEDSESDSAIAVAAMTVVFSRWFNIFSRSKVSR
jgi:hypothetical protein